MRKSVVVSIVVGLIAIYILFWFVVTGGMVNIFNERVFKDQSENYNIAFGKVVRKGFPFSFAIEIQSMIEEQPDSVITHQNPVLLKYEFFKQQFNISYNGSSLAQPKPIERGFGSLIKSEVDIYVGCPFSISLIEVLKDKDRSFELINFIKYISSNVKVQANDLVDGSLLLDAEYLQRADIKDFAYYKNKEELLSSPAVNSYHVISKMNVKQVTKNRVISPISLIYGAIPNNQIEIDLVADISFPFLNPMSDFEVKITESSKSDFVVEDHGSIYFKSKFIDKNGHAEVVVKNVSNLKEGYIDYLNSNIVALSSSAINSGGLPKVVFNVLQDIVTNSEKYKLPNVDLKKLTFDLDVSLKSENNDVNIEVRSFNLLADDTGISLQNKIHLDNMFVWNTSGVLSVNNYDNMFDYVTKYIKQMFPNLLLDDRIVIEKAVTAKLLRNISNHPESQNTNMIFDYSGAADGFKIGDRNIGEIVNLYNSYLYAQVLDMVRLDPKFIDKIATLLPELFANKEAMKKLKEASNPQSVKP